jgi:histidinol-phosphate/aromatic aminotransferase/cobyric acid decarboxylase-like protein
MTQIPTPTVNEAVQILRDRDEFKAVIKFIKDERERFFSDLRQAENERDVMKIVGSVSTLDELLQILS